MKKVKDKRRGREVIDEGKRRARADSRRLMKSVQCASVHRLMKGKQQHAFLSLALISLPLWGVCCECTKEAVGRKKTHDRQRRRCVMKGKNKRRGWSLKLKGDSHLSLRTKVATLTSLPTHTHT